MCRAVQKDEGGITCEGIETVGRCPENKIPYLDVENYETWGLWQLMAPGLIRSDGGYDYNAIEIVWNAHGIEQARRMNMLTTIIKLIAIIEKAREK